MQLIDGNNMATCRCYQMLTSSITVQPVPSTSVQHEYSLEPAHSAKAWCKFALLKLEGHSGGTYSVRLDNMSGPITGGAAIVSTILTFDFQYVFNCRVSSPSVS